MATERKRPKREWGDGGLDEAEGARGDRGRKRPKREDEAPPEKVHWGKKEEGAEEEEEDDQPKQKPNFVPSGLLDKAATQKKNGVELKWIEPPEAKKPSRMWYLYPFKGKEALPRIALAGFPSFMLGRDRKVSDVPLDHPSCSSQHAVIVFRQISEKDQYQQLTGKRVVRPYIIDLNSTNGTKLNGEMIEPQRYYQLLEKDAIQFGFSSREFILLSDDSTDPSQASNEEVVESI